MDEAQSKILRGIEGLGAVTPQMIEERAHEIAQGEGRAETNDLDGTRAREDLTGSTSGSEEPPPSSEADRDWYTPLGSSGAKAPTVRLKMKRTFRRN